MLNDKINVLFEDTCIWRFPTVKSEWYHMGGILFFFFLKTEKVFFLGRSETCKPNNNKQHLATVSIIHTWVFPPEQNYIRAIKPVRLVVNWLAEDHICSRHQPKRHRPNKHRHTVTLNILILNIWNYGVNSSSLLVLVSLLAGGMLTFGRTANPWESKLEEEL